jgi:hypothetical protein
MDTLDSEEDAASGRSGFCVADIIWAVSVWSVILTLSPIVMFYVLMVN